MVPQTLYNYKCELKRLQGLAADEQAHQSLSKGLKEKLAKRIVWLEDKLATFKLPERRPRRTKDDRAALPKIDMEERARKIKEDATKRLKKLSRGDQA